MPCLLYIRVASGVSDISRLLWMKKSCTSWQLSVTIKQGNGINHLPTGAGFLLSTICWYRCWWLDDIWYLGEAATADRLFEGQRGPDGEQIWNLDQRCWSLGCWWTIFFWHVVNTCEHKKLEVSGSILLRPHYDFCRMGIGVGEPSQHGLELNSSWCIFLSVQIGTGSRERMAVDLPKRSKKKMWQIISVFLWDTMLWDSGF